MQKVIWRNIKKTIQANRISRLKPRTYLPTWPKCMQHHIYSARTLCNKNDWKTGRGVRTIFKHKKVDNRCTFVWCKVAFRSIWFTKYSDSLCGWWERFGLEGGEERGQSTFATLRGLARSKTARSVRCVRNRLLVICRTIDWTAEYICEDKNKSGESNALVLPFQHNTV